MSKKQSPNTERQLMIKTKACQRLRKEVEYYHKEVEENESKLEEMKSANRDPYDIKKFKEVLDESYMMVPDSRNRLERSLEDLAHFLDSAEIKSLASSEWYGKAEELLQAAKTDEIDNDFKATDVNGVSENEAF